MRNVRKTICQYQVSFFLIQIENKVLNWIWKELFKWSKSKSCNSNIIFVDLCICNLLVSNSFTWTVKLSTNVRQISFQTFITS